MPDPIPPADAPAAPVPAVSPTGEAIVPPIVVKIVLPIVAVAGAIAIAPMSGIDVSFLPPVVLKVCALVAFIGNLIALAGPGARKSVP